MSVESNKAIALVLVLVGFLIDSQKWWVTIIRKKARYWCWFNEQIKMTNETKSRIVVFMVCHNFLFPKWQSDWFYSPHWVEKSKIVCELHLFMVGWKWYLACAYDWLINYFGFGCLRVIKKPLYAFQTSRLISHR